MATVTIRPDTSVLTPNPPWVLTGAGAAHTALNDNSDSTYVAHDTSLLNYILKVGFATAVIPALAQIRLVTFRYRIQFPSWVAGDNQMFMVQMRTINVDGYEVTRQVDVIFGSDATIKTISGTAQPLDPGGAYWDPVEIDQLEAHFWYSAGTQGSTAFRLLELYADVLYNEAPVTVVTAPTEGGVVGSTRPTIAWTFTDPENDAQDRYRIKIFDAATYGAGDFNVDTSLAKWDSGEVYSELKSVDLPVDLDNGTTYRVYVKTADVLSNGRYSNWDYNQFSISLSPPAPPSISVSPNDVGGYIDVTIQGGDNMLTANQASLETDATGWILDNAATISRVTTAGSFSNGVAALQIAATGANARARITPVFDVTPGKAYAFFAKFKKAIAGTKNGRIVVRWYQADGTTPASTASNTGADTAFTNAAHTQAVLLATAPANAAKATLVVEVVNSANAENYWVDEIGARPGTSVTWTRGGVASSVIFMLEYSDDGGTTWLLHRTGEALVPDSTQNQVATMRDYEVPPGVERLYRARSTAVV